MEEQEEPKKRGGGLLFVHDDDKDEDVDKRERTKYRGGIDRDGDRVGGWDGGAAVTRIKNPGVVSSRNNEPKRVVAASSVKNHAGSCTTTSTGKKKRHWAERAQLLFDPSPTRRRLDRQSLRAKEKNKKARCCVDGNESKQRKQEKFGFRSICVQTAAFPTTTAAARAREQRRLQSTDGDGDGGGSVGSSSVGNNNNNAHPSPLERQQPNTADDDTLRGTIGTYLQDNQEEEEMRQQEVLSQHQPSTLQEESSADSPAPLCVDAFLVEENENENNETEDTTSRTPPRRWQRSGTTTAVAAAGAVQRQPPAASGLPLAGIVVVHQQQQQRRCDGRRCCMRRLLCYASCIVVTFVILSMPPISWNDPHLPFEGIIVVPKHNSNNPEYDTTASGAVCVPGRFYFVYRDEDDSFSKIGSVDTMNQSNDAGGAVSISGCEHVNDLAFDRTGTAYALCKTSSSQRRRRRRRQSLVVSLVTVDPRTGDTTQILSPPGISMDTLAFNPVDDQFYAFVQHEDQQGTGGAAAAETLGKLGRNETHWILTFAGDPIYDFTCSNPGIDRNGNAFCTDNLGDDDDDWHYLLYSLNFTTGTLTGIGKLPFKVGRPLAFDENNTLHAIEEVDGSSSSRLRAFRVNGKNRIERTTVDGGIELPAGISGGAFCPMNFSRM